MKKKDFFTEEFYANPQLTLNILNELVAKNHVADREMYQNGDFLYMEVYENEETRKILAPIISDFETYKEYNNENFASDYTTQIGLCALQDEHTEAFRSEEGNKCINWNYQIESFVFAEDMPSRFD